LDLFVAWVALRVARRLRREAPDRLAARGHRASESLKTDGLRLEESLACEARRSGVATNASRDTTGRIHASAARHRRSTGATGERSAATLGARSRATCAARRSSARRAAVSWCVGTLLVRATAASLGRKKTGENKEPPRAFHE
jgi:hypothetical protein